MAKIKTWIVNNWFFRKAYSCKFYLDLGVRQVSWFIGKFPEIMATVYLLEKAGYTLTINQIILLGACSFFGLTVLGFFWKKIGLFDTEVYVDAGKNPVTVEVLESARIIKKKFGEKE